MLVIKLKRVGKKHQANFRLIVDEKRHRLFGKNTEDLGWFNPIENKSDFKKERILHWIKNGAQTSDTVHNLLVTAGIIAGKKIAVHKQPKAKKGDAKSAEGAAATTASSGKASEVKPAAEAKPAEQPTA